MLKSKYIDISWDFRNADTKRYTHCFHSYPAMMIPQVASRLIDKYGICAKLLFDPYCGTGTSLVEANLRGIDAIGADLNPLAVLIAKAKTSAVDMQTLGLYLNDFNDKMFEFRFKSGKTPEVDLPTFNNIDFWFTQDIKYKLAIINKYIRDISIDEIRDFFTIAFSETVRESSLTRNCEFKLYRMTDAQMKKFDPDPFGLMESKLLRNYRGLKEFSDAKNNSSQSYVYQLNTVERIPADIVGDGEVDIVVTSPPYGDSRTTVAYGQFSRLSNQWLGGEEASALDERLMGGRQSSHAENIEKFGIGIIDDTVDVVRRENENRALDIYRFYRDYESSIANVSKAVRIGGYCCYVVGNRRVCGTTLQTDEMTRDLFEKQGFEHIETIVRNIPNKRMPSRNSPSNIVGESDTTMKNEYIVVMQKTA